jgi:hypothetical protein
VRSMALRCFAGEFDGSAVKAARTPECIRLGIDEADIRYHIARVDPAPAAARAADRARLATETAAAGVGVQFIFVERAGSAPAAAAIVAALGAIETEIGGIGHSSSTMRTLGIAEDRGEDRGGRKLSQADTGHRPQNF